MDKLSLSSAAPSQSAPADERQQLAALRAQLQEALQALKAEAAGLFTYAGRDAAGIALLPLRLTFGLGLAVGVLWGLWQAFT